MAVSFQNIRKKIRQWESLTGRKAPPSLIQEYMKAELAIDRRNINANRALDIDQQRVDIAKERAITERDLAESAAKSAKISGIADIVSGGAGLYLLGKEAGIGKKIGSLFGKGKTGVATAGTSKAIGTGTYGLEGSLTGRGAGGIYGSGGRYGLEGSLTEGTPRAISTGTLTPKAIGTTGGEFSLASEGLYGVGAGTGAGATGSGFTLASEGFYGAGGAATPVAGAGATAGTTAAPSIGSTLTGTVLPAAGAGGVAGLIGSLLTKAGQEGHKGGEVITGRAIGAAGGAAGGFALGAAAGVPFGGPIGAVIGGVIGAITGGGSVICTELHRQGYMTDEVYKLDEQFSGRVDIDTYVGYRKLADPIVTLMQKSKLATKITALIALPWAEEMAHQMNPDRKGNMFGKFLMKAGGSLCRIVGKRQAKINDALYEKYMEVS